MSAPRPYGGPAGAGDAAGELPVVAFMPDLMDRSRITAVTSDVVFVGTVADLAATPARLVLLDLGRAGALEALPAIVARGVRVVGFGSHVDDDLLTVAREAGCTDVLPRSRFFRQFLTYF